MPGCRDLRLLPALRLRLTGREKQPADTGRFARYRHFVLRTRKGFHINFELFVPEASAANEIPRAQHSPTSGLRMKNDSVVQFPLLAGGNRSRLETSDDLRSARRAGDD